ncbi:MAG: AAA family ATPase, partial [Acidimicrobiia bacterium]|nr:AAA family ATPase [Acidimicrobiia bacterium]
MARLPPAATQLLPLRRSPLFGRDAERAQLEGIVPQARLLTLTGAPGSGKTRLALEVSERLAPRFRDGVHVAELAAPLPAPVSVATSVGAALGIEDTAGRGAEAAIAEALTEAELLLVLDDCGHVAGAAGELAHHLLERCPQVRVLATSQVPLGVPGEQVWDVPALDVEPAVELFLDRAGLAGGDSRVDGPRGSPVEQICRRLDGLPLAVELAAAWAGEHSLGELDGLLAAAVPGHQTMEATVDWSYGLLGPAEQQLLDRLSVFTRGFVLHAAEHVAAMGDVPGLLGALVEHSLVLAVRASELTVRDMTEFCPLLDGPDGPMRYHLAEPVRRRAAEGLADQGAEGATRRRHAEYFLEVARHCDVGLRGEYPGHVLFGLGQYEGNLRSALAWARRHHRDLGLELCIALAHFWELRGRV